MNFIKKNALALLANLNSILKQQTDSILHNKKLQSLEANWQGLAWLCQHTPSHHNLKIKLLDCAQDNYLFECQRTTDYEHTTLFKLLFKEYDQAGAEPFSLLLCSYTFDHKQPSISQLSALIATAQHCFCAVASSVDKTFFKIPSIEQLNKINLNYFYENEEYQDWKACRNNPDSIFVNLSLPEILMRPPYHGESARKTTDYLWGNSVFSVGLDCILKFIESNHYENETTKARKTKKIVTKMTMRPDTLSQLEKLGLTIINEDKHYQFQNKIQHFSFKNTELNFIDILFLCRIIHHIKSQGRNLIGSKQTQASCQKIIHQWLQHYTVEMNPLNSDFNESYPFCFSSVNVKLLPGKWQAYLCELSFKIRKKNNELDFINFQLTI